MYRRDTGMNDAAHTGNGSVYSADIKIFAIAVSLLRQHIYGQFIKKVNISIRIQTTQAHTAVNSEEYS